MAAWRVACWFVDDEADEWLLVVLEAEDNEEGDDGEPIDLDMPLTLVPFTDSWPNSESFIVDINFSTYSADVISFFVGFLAIMKIFHKIIKSNGFVALL